MEGGIPQVGNIKKGVNKTKRWNPWGGGDKGSMGCQGEGGMSTGGKPRWKAKVGMQEGVEGENKEHFPGGPKGGFGYRKCQKVGLVFTNG